MTATAPLAPIDLAAILGTDPRTTRKFLRSITPLEEQPGKGARWSIKGTKANIATLTKKFAAFNEAEATAKADRAAKAEAKSLEVPTEAIEAAGLDLVPLDEVMTDDDFEAELEGPTDEELLAIDDEA